MKALLACVALLAVGFSGCITDNVLPTDDGPADVRPGLWVYGPGAPEGFDAAAYIAAHPPGNTTYVLTEHQGAEPSMGVTSSGAVFINADNQVLRSTDRGASWDVVHTDMTGNSDPMLWVDPITDWIYNAPMFPILACSTIYISKDDGASWSRPAPECGRTIYDHQKLASGKPGPGTNPKAGVLHKTVLYMCYNGVATTNCGVSYDGGTQWAWDRIVDVNTVNDCFSGQNGRPGVGPDGTVLVPRGMGCKELWLYRSRDSGATWEALRGPAMPPPQVYGKDINFEDDMVAGFGINPDLAYTPDGITYLSFQAPDGRQYVARSKDYGTTWDKPFDVTPPGVKSTVFGVIDAGSNGRVAIAFLGAEKDKLPSVMSKGTPWHLYVVTSENANDDAPVFVARQVTTKDDPVQFGCVWEGGGGGGPNACRNMLDFIDSGKGPDGTFYVGYTEGYTPDGEPCGNRESDEEQSRGCDIAVARLDGWSLLVEGLSPAKASPSLGDVTQLLR